jgi:hypothetical protein
MRFCIFCAAPASSKEDAWPLWLLRQIGTGMPARIDAERGTQPLRSWRVVGTGLTVRFVCAPCNNGWMSELENRVKPIVLRLLDNAGTNLTVEEQTTLASWSVKNAMVFEALRIEQPWFFSAGERNAFRESLSPPARTNVWIAKCVEQAGVYSCATNLSGTVEGSSTRMEAYVTTMGFGALGIQVVGGKLPAEVPLATTVTVDQTPGPWDDATVRIWPGPRQVVNWPPPIGLHGELGLEAFGDRWGPHQD